MNITFTFAECMKLILVWKCLSIIAALIMNAPKFMEMCLKAAKEDVTQSESYKEYVKGLEDYILKDYDKVNKELEFYKKKESRKILGFQSTSITNEKSS